MGILTDKDAMIRIHMDDLFEYSGGDQIISNVPQFLRRPLEEMILLIKENHDMLFEWMPRGAINTIIRFMNQRGKINLEDNLYFTNYFRDGFSWEPSNFMMKTTGFMGSLILRQTARVLGQMGVAQVFRQAYADNLPNIDFRPMPCIQRMTIYAHPENDKYGIHAPTSMIFEIDLRDEITGNKLLLHDYIIKYSWPCIYNP